MVEPIGAICRQAKGDAPGVTRGTAVLSPAPVPGPLPAPGVAGKEPVMTATATSVPRSPVTGADLRNVAEMSRMSRGLTEMSAQMSKMSAKCRSDVRNVPVHWKPHTAQEVHGR